VDAEVVDLPKLNVNTTRLYLDLSWRLDLLLLVHTCATDAFKSAKTPHMDPLGWILPVR
jgi:hypothetical protein